MAAPALLWLLDEPRTGLDADAVARLDTAIEDHRAAGGLVVLSLHGSRGPEGAEELDLASFEPVEDALLPC